MIGKKNLLVGLILTATIALSVNIIINNNKIDKPAKKTSNHLTCEQFKEALKKQNYPPIEDLSPLLKSSLDWLSATDKTCEAYGNNWSLKNGLLKVQNSKMINTHDGINPATIKF